MRLDAVETGNYLYWWAPLYQRSACARCVDGWHLLTCIHPPTAM